MAFEKERLTGRELADLKELSRQAKGDIIKMTTLAASGHPGGSMSSLDIYLTVFSQARLADAVRDRIVVSHGHTSPGVYAALGRLGHLPVDEAIAFFRKAKSPFEGHVVQGIPFMDWSTGNLGQGLSAGCGFALSQKVFGTDFHVYVLMSDGEQAKGQVGEARRFAKKYNLTNITVVIDWNRIQISGCVDDVMPVNIAENYLADGWDVLEVDGHDHNEIYGALRRARISENPTCILARTVIGHGVPFMEGKAEFHGSPLNQKQYEEALKVLGLEDDLDTYRQKRKGTGNWKPSFEKRSISIEEGEPLVYTKENAIDNRSAFGKALRDLGERNMGKGSPICAFDCDLASSVKTSDFAKSFPDYFCQCGVQEHNTATVAGALSATGVVTFFADFGVFGLDETYNQHRLNDINRTNLKVVLTHLGLDVGQDGKTHQCIDYIGLAKNLFHFKTIIPADPNQVDRVVRYITREDGNFVLGTGRSKWPVLYNDEGRPFYGDGYRFLYGKMDVMASGEDGAIITYGGMVYRALEIRERLMAKGMTLKVVNMACVNLVDEEVMKELVSLPFVFTYEDHNPETGIAPLIARALLKGGCRGKMETFGVTDYGPSGETEDILKVFGLDVGSMTEGLLKIVKG
jgi:transketolase